jgi:glutamate synthase (NADPH/NADH) small chain
MTLGEPDASGRRRPVSVPDSAFALPVDTVILAIGQSLDAGCLPEGDSLTVDRWNCLVADKETLQTPVAGVFAAATPLPDLRP